MSNFDELVKNLPPREAAKYRAFRIINAKQIEVDGFVDAVIDAAKIEILRDVKKLIIESMQEVMR